MKIFWLRPKNSRSFSEKSFSRVIKTAFYVSRWYFRGKSFGKFICVFLFLFDSWAKKLDIRWKLFSSPSKLYLTFPRQQLEKNFGIRINRKLTIFGALVKIFPRGSSKLLFSCSQPNFEHLINFWQNFCI